jgi:hydroxyacyl-ACP dehydratase HTD2-like protein with hotdog domain
MKHLKQTSKTHETIENIDLQHACIAIATYATSKTDFCNIQIKPLKQTQTLETRHQTAAWLT